MQPMFKDSYKALPNTEKLMNEMLALPFFIHQRFGSEQSCSGY